MEPQVQSDIPVGFTELAELANARSGLVLSNDKASMIQSRLRKRLKALNVDNLSDYVKAVQRDSSDSEWQEMVQALTTNVSSFYREPHHFELLRDLIKRKLARTSQTDEPVRIWSAGCSTGQEAYSISMTALEINEKLTSRHFKVLATDIDANVLKTASVAKYDASQLSDIPASITEKYFDLKLEGENASAFVVTPRARDLVFFNHLNLISEWPMTVKFDAIFCRNVVIYFDQQTQSRLWPRFGALLKDDGLIFVGHSERITSPEFEPAGTTAYRKRCSHERASTS